MLKNVYEQPKNIRHSYNGDCKLIFFHDKEKNKYFFHRCKGGGQLRTIIDLVEKFEKVQEVCKECPEVIPFIMIKSDNDGYYFYFYVFFLKYTLFGFIQTIELFVRFIQSTKYRILLFLFVSILLSYFLLLLFCWSKYQGKWINFFSRFVQISSKCPIII